MSNLRTRSGKQLTVKMNRPFLCFVFTWLSCAAANVPIKSCSGCIGYAACPAAVTLLHMKTPASDTKLKSAFCGFDSASLPKVCCSELAPVQPTRVLTETEGVENHPNLGLLPAECGKIDGNKIIGGTVAGLYEFPWMVLISYNSRFGLRFECGGSLINERYVLTAAHCIANLKLAGVRVGEHDVDTDTDCEGEPPLLTCESRLQDLRIEKAIAHENYQGKPLLKNDIGLLRLRKPVNLALPNAATICLPVTRELQNRDLGGLNATVAGWGYTETGRVSSKLLGVEVPIHTRESCSGLYNRGAAAGAEDQTLNKLCAGENGKDSCGGDSGGPLMVKGAYKTLGHRYIQHGVVSYGPRLCGSDFPGVYTDVSKYMTWILNNIKP